MAKVKIQGHASGTGILTVTAPNTSTDRTITLPDATGTLLNSDGSAASLTAIPAANITGTLPAIDGSNLTGVASYRPNANPIVINGDMRIAQRSVSETGVTGTGFQTVDRWNHKIISGGTWTITQSTDAPAGFTTSLKLDCTSTSTVSGSERCYNRYHMEGQDLQLLNKGTAQAEATTVAFWVKSTKTGTFVCALRDQDNNRGCSQQYTISSSDTWEKKVINFPADTTGTLNNDNNESLAILFGNVAGSNYTSGTLQTSWAARVDADMFVGQVNGGDSTSNNFLMTGVQLEIGTYTSATIPPFQHESYGVSLARCQRYYHQQGRQGGDGYEALVNVAAHSVNNARGVYHLPTTMRVFPTLSSSGSFQVVTGGDITAWALTDGGGNPGVGVEATTSGSYVVNDADTVRSKNDADAYLAFDAEL
jgi:hypothetical protein